MNELVKRLGLSRVSAGDRSKDDESASEPLVIRTRPTIWADIANAVWNLDQRSRDPETSERKDGFRPIARHIDRLNECLAEIGIEIQSHTNNAFDSGQSIEVLAFQPTAGITMDVVIETVRPTIYLKGHRVQLGQVIVATPECSGEEDQQCPE
jgi:hypothetical protein